MLDPPAALESCLPGGPGRMRGRGLFQLAYLLRSCIVSMSANLNSYNVCCPNPHRLVTTVQEALAVDPEARSILKILNFWQQRAIRGVQVQLLPDLDDDNNNAQQVLASFSFLSFLWICPFLLAEFINRCAGGPQEGCLPSARLRGLLPAAAILPMRCTARLFKRSCCGFPWSPSTFNRLTE